jgi:hypothetical protein
MQNEFLVKSIKLVYEIKRALQTHEKVWVVLSEVRGRYISAAKEVINGVSHLYQSLRAADIHYVTLKYFDPKLNESGYIHSQQKAKKIEAGYQKQLEKQKQTFRNSLERDFPSSLSVEKQHQAFTALLDDPSWLNMPLYQAGEVMQFFLERALTWECGQLSVSEKFM